MQMAKPTEKQGYQEDMSAHRIRITLTSRDCGNLEKGGVAGERKDTLFGSFRGGKN